MSPEIIAIILSAVALFVTIVGAAMTLSGKLARLEEQTRAQERRLQVLENAILYVHVPRRDDGAPADNR